MLRSIKDIEGYAIGAADGVIGHVKDLYFDDEAWTVRYFVVDAGGWLSNRKVLVSPLAVGKPGTTEKVLPVSLTREQVKNSPDIDTDKPVSRQHEIEYLGYYGYPLYWGGGEFWGEGIYPGSMLPGRGYDRAQSSATRAERRVGSCRNAARVACGHPSAQLPDRHALQRACQRRRHWTRAWHARRRRDLVDPLSRRQHEQLVARTQGARCAAMDQERELARSDGIGRSDASGR